jgi:hypothetical protein
MHSNSLLIQRKLMLEIATNSDVDVLMKLIIKGHKNVCAP